MAKADRAKEEIGWLKIVFGLAAAGDASLMTWLAQKYSSADFLLVLLAITAAALLTAYVAWVNMVAYRRIRELEGL